MSKIQKNKRKKKTQIYQMERHMEKIIIIKYIVGGFISYYTNAIHNVLNCIGKLSTGVHQRCIYIYTT